MSTVYSHSDVNAALKDTAVKNLVQKHVMKENIQLVHRDSLEPVYRREMSIIGEKGDRAALESPAHKAHVDYDADYVKPEDAQLRVSEPALAEVKAEVAQFVRRNSQIEPQQRAGIKQGR